MSAVGTEKEHVTRKNEWRMQPVPSTTDAI